MRLGQLARKYGISKKEIVNFLKETDPSLHSLGQNTKLDEPMLRLVASRFENAESFGEENTEETNKPEVLTSVWEETEEETPGTEEPDEKVNEAPRAESDTTPATADHQDRPGKRDKPEKTEGLAIETDKLLELLESEDEGVDLSKFTLIKASKKELDGLKVVGKIDLPEPRKKPQGKKDRREKKESEPTGAHGKDKRGTAPHGEGQQLSFEEREKRRLTAKKRQEEYQARQEKRRKEKEKKQQKALNRARYQQKLERARAGKIKPKDQGQGRLAVTEVPEQPAPPKTLLGKLWRWLNTY